MVFHDLPSKPGRAPGTEPSWAYCLTAKEGGNALWEKSDSQEDKQKKSFGGYMGWVGKEVRQVGCCQELMIVRT